MRQTGGCQALESQSKELHELHVELARLKGDNKLLSWKVKSLTKELKDKMTVTNVLRLVTAKREMSTEPVVEQQESSGSSSKDEESSSDNESRLTNSDAVRRHKVK